MTEPTDTAPVKTIDSLPLRALRGLFSGKKTQLAIELAKTPQNTKFMDVLLAEIVELESAILALESRSTHTLVPNELWAEIKRVHNSWIPVSERLPEMHVTVFVCSFNNVTLGKYEGGRNGWSVVDYDEWNDPICNSGEPVTHWQPLPALPPQTFGMNQFDSLFGKQAENDALLKDEPKPIQTL